MRGYRLDFAAAHPEQPGRFVLAIETDGASYHSAPTARDRDRLRQQQLEAIGWRFHRIWSTDWTLRREQEVERAVAAWKAACASKTLSVQGNPTPSTWGATPADAGGAATASFPSADPRPQGEGVARAEPPVVAHRDDIEDVPETELDGLVRWALDGPLRTDDEIVDEVADHLGYARVGTKIDRTVRASLARVREG